MANGKMLPGLNPKTTAQGVNLFLMPNIDPIKDLTMSNGGM